MNTFTSEVRGNGSEEMRWFNVYISPALDPSKAEDWYQIIDTRKTWRNNDGWIRLIKREGQRINFANKSRMTQYDRQIEIHINTTYPLPQ
jgi:hypothetical protein